MRDEIYWMVTATVHPGAFHSFRSVVAPLGAETRKEEGSLAHDYSVNEDHTFCQFTCRGQTRRTMVDRPVVSRRRFRVDWHTTLHVPMPTPKGRGAHAPLGVPTHRALSVSRSSTPTRHPDDRMTRHPSP